MTVDEVKKLLKSLSTIKTLVKSRERQYNNALKYIELQQAQDYSSPRVSGSCTGSSVEMAVIRLERYKERYLEACEKMFIIEDKIETLLPLLDIEEQSLVVDRFMNDIPLYRLYEKYAYSFDRIKHKYSEIFKKLAGNFVEHW